MPGSIPLPGARTPGDFSTVAPPSTDIVVVGAGVVGLACAAALSRRGMGVIVLERNARAGEEASSHNSGVVHAGLYYPAGSLKAACCVEGARNLSARCERLGIPHRRTGKLIVATNEEERSALDEIEARAIAAGVTSLERFDKRELSRREPDLSAVEALWSPETGIVDAAALTDSYRREALERGASLVLNTNVVGLEPDGDSWCVRTENTRGEREALTTPWVVNAAGLGADGVLALAGVDVDAAGLRHFPCKGVYFSLGRGAPRPRAALVYPVPEQGGLGIHLTVDLGGRCLAGPDARYVERVDHTVDPSLATAFAASVSRYLPGVTAEHLSPDQAGIRPKLSPPGGAFRDFVVADGATLGVPKSVHLLGIESPGLTAAAALADRVAEIVSRSP